MLRTNKIRVENERDSCIERTRFMPKNERGSCRRTNEIRAKNERDFSVFLLHWLSSILWRKKRSSWRFEPDIQTDNSIRVLCRLSSFILKIVCARFRPSKRGLTLLLLITTQDALVDSVDLRSDCTERAVWSLIYTDHIFILDCNWNVSSSCNGRVFLANEKNTIYLFGRERVKASSCSMMRSKQLHS